MKTEPIPRIIPVVNYLKNLSIEDYLCSDKFIRYCIKNNLEELWQSAIEEAGRRRSYFSSGLNHSHLDANDALIIFLNHFYRTNTVVFFSFLVDLLIGYCEFNKCSIESFDIIESIELLNAPANFIYAIKALDKNHKQAVPNVVLDDVLDSKKLEEYLNKMDISIVEKNYNQTLTFCYSCLEGLFKTYIQKNNLTEVETDKLNSLSKIVKENIKQKLEKRKEKHPEQILNLLTTIPSAISEARNHYSVSHFDKDASEWLAVFSRDSVNSIGRLVLKFVDIN